MNFLVSSIISASMRERMASLSSRDSFSSNPDARCSTADVVLWCEGRGRSGSGARVAQFSARCCWAMRVAVSTAWPLVVQEGWGAPISPGSGRSRPACHYEGASMCWYARIALCLNVLASWR